MEPDVLIRDCLQQLQPLVLEHKNKLSHIEINIIPTYARGEFKLEWWVEAHLLKKKILQIVLSTQYEVLHSLLLKEYCEEDRLKKTVKQKSFHNIINGEQFDYLILPYLKKIIPGLSNEITELVTKKTYPLIVEKKAGTYIYQVPNKVKIAFINQDLSWVEAEVARYGKVLLRTR